MTKPADPRAGPGGPVLLYDGECGFCTLSVRMLAPVLPEGAALRPWQAADLGALGVSEARARAEVLWIDPRGRVYGGARAVAALLLARGGAYAALGGLLRVWPVSVLADHLYRLVSTHRGRLPGVTPACALPREEWPAPRERSRPRPPGRRPGRL